MSVMYLYNELLSKEHDTKFSVKFIKTIENSLLYILANPNTSSFSPSGIDGKYTVFPS